MKLRTFFFILFLKCAFFVNGQTTNDTIILFDHWQAKDIFSRYHFNEDALLVIIKMDSFLLDASKNGEKMMLNNSIRYLKEKRTSGSTFFYRLSYFSGIRIIMAKDKPSDIQIQTIKTREPNKRNNQDFDTTIQMNLLVDSHQMLWNVHYIYVDYPCNDQPCRFVNQYQMHFVNLPQIAEIKKERKAAKKIAAIEKTLLYEVNLVTGIITNYKTGEQRKVKEK